MMVEERIEKTGKLIKNARELKGLRQSDVAEILEISLQHYAGIEQGRHGMSLRLAIRIADELEISLDHLFARNEEWIDYYYNESAKLLIECFRKNEKNMDILMKFAGFLRENELEPRT